MGNLGALITRVDKISLQEFVKHNPVSQVVGPTLDLLHQQVVEALSTYDSKVQLTLEEFRKAPNGIHSSVEEYLNQLRSSLIEQLSQVFVDRVSESISSFPNVSAILSRLSKVETEVDTWKEWNPDEGNPRDEVPKVSHPSSSAYHDPPIRSTDHNCDPTGGGHNSCPRVRATGAVGAHLGLPEGIEGGALEHDGGLRILGLSTIWGSPGPRSEGVGLL